MEYSFVILFHTEDGREIQRVGKGLFYPHDRWKNEQLNIHEILWDITEKYNVRPEAIEIHMNFAGSEHGTEAPKRLEGSQTAPTRTTSVSNE